MQKFHLVWDDNRHCLGIDSIDHQHHTLVDKVNELSDAVEQGCDCSCARSHMEGIIEFIREHFAHEEALMREHDFPGLEQHAAEHADLLCRSATLMQEIKPGIPGRAMLATAFLIDCVERHIQAEDLPMAQHLLNRKPNSSSPDRQGH